jgi:16S rRNA (cytosine967-C5)-methyltransferase
MWIIHSLLTTKIKPKDMAILPLMAVGLYQLMEMRVAEHAAIKETVEITKFLNKPWWTGLVNAVLRSYQRNAADILKTIEADEFCKTSNVTDLECYYLHPIWFVNAVKKAWSHDYDTMLKQNNSTPPLTLRVNQKKTTAEKYLTLLSEENMIAHPFKETYLSNALIIENPIDVQNLPGYDEGFFSVQDAAAQLAAELLNLEPNQNVLDACAAPGVKTTHLFEIEPTIKVTAVDISGSRLKTLEENCHRLKVNPTIITADVVNTAQWWDHNPFDRILLDAPCSATGVIRRHPDIKFLRNPEDIPKFSKQQLDLLFALWPLLKPGGILLYATCSVLPAENNEVIEAFLAKQQDAQLMPISLSFGIPLPIGHQILAGQNNLDGFYYSRLLKL